MRFVGFNSKVRRQIVEYEGKDTAVTLSVKLSVEIMTVTDSKFT